MLGAKGSGEFLLNQIMLSVLIIVLESLKIPNGSKPKCKEPSTYCSFQYLLFFFFLATTLIRRTAPSFLLEILELQPVW